MTEFIQHFYCRGAGKLKPRRAMGLVERHMRAEGSHPKRTLGAWIALGCFSGRQ
ncbi:MAG: hypothetical protein KA144_01810 [Xanthomonadaceae bacterium]|nr:hypothetical protein [Xanthomonadaceae bacterium]